MMRKVNWLSGYTGSFSVDSVNVHYLRLLVFAYEGPRPSAVEWVKCYNEWDKV